MPMKADIKSILEEYSQRRAKEEARVNDILKMLLNTNQNLKKDWEDYLAARAGQAAARLDGKKISIEKEKAKYEKTLKDACKANGIDSDDLKIKYDCDDCKDTGYIGSLKKTYCHCLINRATKDVLSNQNLVEDATFENFDDSIFPAKEQVGTQGRSQREHILYVKDRALKWCRSFPDTNKLQTLFIGATGVGKSYMVNCIAHEIIKKGYSVVNSKASGINEAMLNVINNRDNSLISLFKTCDLLIIDDLGAEPVLRNITVETLYDIIEYRLANKKHTIIVTNLTMKTMQDRYGYRISSRVSSTKNTALMNILGEDLRRL